MTAQTVVAPTLMMRLRAETREAHEAIDGAIDLETSLASPSAYCALLARFYAFHAGWEPVLASLIGDPAFFDSRRKLGLLAADLTRLGLAPERIAALASCPPAPTVTTISAAYGAMYVLEGSTLGGQLISRQVAERLGFSADDGAAYYNAYGRAVGGMWRAFGERVNQAAPMLDGEAVIAGARDAFAQLKACLAR